MYFATVTSKIYDDRISVPDAGVVCETTKSFEDSQPTRSLVFENGNMVLRNALLLVQIGRKSSSVRDRTTKRPDVRRFIPIDTYNQSEETWAEEKCLCR